jgi:nicotinamidase/pyrazinamidase
MNRIALSESSLLVVDVQHGFSELCPDELPVPGALAIVANVNRLLVLPWRRIDASQDWHPPSHCSFLGERHNLYPPHCVMGTRGADFLPQLQTDRFHTIWRKGYHPHEEAYAITAQHPAFPALLHASGIKLVIVCGLATNICCFYAAKDLRQQGFAVLIAEDASAGIDVPAANLYQHQAREEAHQLGIRYVTTQAILDAAEAGR